MGQQGTLIRIWARRGSRPRAPRDRGYTSAYIFGAVCPDRCIGAAVIMPDANIEAMEAQLVEVSRCVTVGAHAVLVLDGAGWHTSPKLRVPDNLSLLMLPRYSPEQNPVENVWEFLRANFLSHRVWDGYDAIVDACCDAWNKLMRMAEQIASITTRAWAQVDAGAAIHGALDLSVFSRSIGPLDDASKNCTWHQHSAARRRQSCKGENNQPIWPTRALISPRYGAKPCRSIAGTNQR